MKEFYKDLSKLARSRRTFLAWRHKKLQEMKDELLEDDFFALINCLDGMREILLRVKDSDYDPIALVNKWYRKPLEKYMKITNKYISLIENRENSYNNKSSWLSYNYNFIKKYNIHALDIDRNEELYQIYNKVIYMQEVVTNQF